MSIIAVSNIPNKVPLPKIVNRLAWVIKGEFEALNCVAKGKSKTCYIQLSEKLDPLRVVEKLLGTGKFQAFVPDHVPDLQPCKNGKIPFKTRRKLGLLQTKPEQVFIITHMSILTEMQSKFSGLFNLSRKTGHWLLENIAETIIHRLKQIIDTNADTLESGFRLSAAYRRLHPHFGDFQMILSTLHRLQDAVHVPRAQLSESELAVASLEPFLINGIPYKVVEAACKKYSEKIVQKIAGHIDELNVEMTDEDTEEDVARKKVRKELKNLSPYLPLIIKQVIANHFVPEKIPYRRIRIYGEPTLPQRTDLVPFLRKYSAIKIVRSAHMYNMVQCSIPWKQISALQDKDGTVFGDSKIFIRASDIPLYKPTKFLAEMRAIFGVAERGEWEDNMMGEEENDDEDDQGEDAMED